LQMGDCGIAVPAVPKGRQRAIEPDRRLGRERGVEVGETSASAAAYFEQPRGLGCARRSLNRLCYLGIELDLMGLVRPSFRHGIVGGRIAVVEGRYLLPLRQAIGAVVNIAVQPVRCAYAKAGTDEMLEDAERRQCREDSCLSAGAGISGPWRPVQRLQCRLDVLVEAEQVRRIVFVLQGDEPLVALAVGGSDPRGFF